MAEPAHDRDGFAVASGLAAETVRAFGGRLAALGDQRVIIEKSLKPLALNWNESAYR
jgi:hypothetical protein